MFSGESSGYTKQQFDKGTGLYYYGARFYDPDIGRFISADSIIDGAFTTQGWNRYMYVHGNPVMNSDPTGMNVYNPWAPIEHFPDDPSTGSNDTGLTSQELYELGLIADGQDWIHNDSHSKSGELLPPVPVSLDLANMSAGSNGPAVSAAFNFDFGADYYSESMKNFQNKDYFSGTIHYLDFMCEAGYNGLAVFLGVQAISSLTIEAVPALIDKIKGLGKGSNWAKQSGMIRDILKTKGNFGIGSSSTKEALRLGKDWVGSGYRVIRQGGKEIWQSKDGLRQFRLPSFKPSLNKWQANFEWRLEGIKRWIGNGHLDIKP